MFGLPRLQLYKVNNLSRKAKDLFAYTKVTATHANSIPDSQKEDYATPVKPFINYGNNGRSLLRPCERSVKPSSWSVWGEEKHSSQIGKALGDTCQTILSLNNNLLSRFFCFVFLMLGNQVGLWTLEKVDSGGGWDPAVPHTLRNPISKGGLGPCDGLWQIGVKPLDSLHVGGIDGASWVGDKRFLKAWRGSWHRGVCPVL